MDPISISLIAVGTVVGVGGVTVVGIAAGIAKGVAVAKSRKAERETALLIERQHQDLEEKRAANERAKRDQERVRLIKRQLQEETRAAAAPGISRPRAGYWYSEYGGMFCHLACMIIASFGDEREYDPSTRAVPKISPKAAFLPGVRKDVKIAKRLIAKDPYKHLDPRYIYEDFPGQGTLRPKDEYLGRIRTFLANCKEPGALLWYTGHGQQSTGAWCFKDGVITFDEIFDLYLQHFKGKLLYIVSDCCYSGEWVNQLAKKLDDMGIPACGHQAKQHGICIKVFTSCLPHEKAFDGLFSECGVTSCENDNVMAFYQKEICNDQSHQTTLSMDTTKSRCFQEPDKLCRFLSLPPRSHWMWKDIQKPGSLDHRLFINRGTDKGRQAWHYVFVHEDLVEEFRARTMGANAGKFTTDLTKYGYVVCSGWGDDPPEDVKKRVEMYGPS